MKTRHLPVRHLATPLLLSLLAACGGGGANPSANLVSAPVNGTQAGGSGGNGSKPGVAPGTNGTGSAGSGQAGGNQPGSSNSAGNGSQPGAGTSGNHGGSSDSPRERISWTGCKLNYFRGGPVVADKTGSDPNQTRQWYLTNTGSLPGFSTDGMVAGEDLRVQGAWDQGMRGEGIRIAVIDDALEVTHEDLRANVVAGSHNYRRLSPNAKTIAGHADYPMPCTEDNDHGTQVGGVIAARDGNGIGVAGVAPRAGLVGFNALANSLTEDALDALVRDINRNHVYNNSWGAADIGHFFAPDNKAAFDSTLNDGLSKGRDGLGVIYTFAAGNGAFDGDYSPMDGTVSARGIVTVCATNAAGTRAPYSERGPNLTVCAPSADLSRTLGIEGAPTLPDVSTTALQNQYTDSFNGTSAATPMVSGVVALMLQANPKLTWRDVPLILARSARQVDAKSSGWRSHNSPIVEGQPGAYDTLRYHHDYGFGVVNADAAVKLSRNWQSVGGSSTQKQCGPFTTRVNAPIPEADAVATNPVRKSQAEAFRKALIEAGNRIDYNQAAANGLTSTVSVPESCQITHIEHIEVTLTASNADGSDEHPSAGDLHITLQSPLGSVSTLSVPHPCQLPTDNGSMQIGPCQGLQNYPFGVRRHLEEPVAQGSNRNWTLSATDRVAGETGRLKDWSITFYGR